MTGSQGGDKSGHSSYHAMAIRMERRFSQGLTFQWNYTFSKLLTDSDNYAAGSGTSQDQYNPEKSIGQFDQTHALKLSTLYELPWGRGRRWLNSGGIASHIFGGWRVSALPTYLSGFPIALARNNPLPIFNGTTRPTVTSYDNWRPPIKGDEFDPAVDLFLDRSVFPNQPAAFGNVTRYNPKLRAFPVFNENVSLAKTFSFSEDFRLDFRWEMFNMFNRVVFSTPSTNLNSNVFGVVTGQANEARQMQIGLKLYW